MTCHKILYKQSRCLSRFSPPLPPFRLICRKQITLVVLKKKKEKEIIAFSFLRGGGNIEAGTRRQQLWVDLQFPQPLLLPQGMMGLRCPWRKKAEGKRWGGELLILSFKHKICYTTLSVRGKAIIVWFNFPLNDCTEDQSQLLWQEENVLLFYLLLKILFSLKKKIILPVP